MVTTRFLKRLREAGFVRFCGSALAVDLGRGLGFVSFLALGLYSGFKI